MKKLINAALWLSGSGPKLWDKVDGAKTYLAVAAKVFTALAGFLAELQPQLDAHNLGALVMFCKAISTDPNWKMMTDALLALGLGHKAQKIANALTPASSEQPGDVNQGK